MAATMYQVELVNSTSQPYHFAIYQKYPDSPGLQSVAWQIERLGHGAQETVCWKMQYSVAITDWDEINNAYKGKQLVPAELKKTYEVKYADGDIPDISDSPTGDVSMGHIKLTNNTKENMKLGFGVDGKLIVIQDKVRPGESSEFYVHPTYYVACYHSIKYGQLVDAGVQLDPVELRFEDGYTAYKVEAINDGGVFRLNKPVPISTQ